MRLRIVMATMAMLASLSAAGEAAESPGKRDASGMPKGSFSASCACQFSGGVELACFCANTNAKWFRTTMDVRSCPGPKDIKNCDGVLTCTAGSAAACPGAH